MTILYLRSLRMLQHKLPVHLFWLNSKDMFPYNYMYRKKIDPHCSPTLTLINHDSNKLESTLSEDASTRVSFFLAKWFLKIPHLEQLKRTCSNVSKNVFSTCIHYFSYKFHDTCQRRVFTL